VQGTGASSGESAANGDTKDTSNEESAEEGKVVN